MIVAPVPETTQMIVRAENPAAIAAGSNGPLAAAEASRLPDYDRFRQILRGPSVAKRMIDSDTGPQTIARALPAIDGDALKNRDTGSGLLANALMKSVSIAPVGMTPQLTLSFRSTDARAAAAALGALYTHANAIIRDDSAARTAARISYLQGAMTRAVNPEHRRVLADLLMAQERVKMMISMDQPFAAQIVEPVSVDPAPVWPVPSILFPLCALIGAAAGYFIHLIRRKAS